MSNNFDAERIRVKYYSRNDFAYGLGIEIINNYYPNEPFPLIGNTNDAIECYNLLRYFTDTDFSHKDWDNKTITDLKNYSPKLKEASFKYISQINPQDFCSIVKNLDNRYFDDFVFLIDKTQLYKRLRKEDFYDLFVSKNLLLQDILENEKLSKYLKDEIHRYFDFDIFATELLIRYADSQNNTEIKRLYIPNEVLKNRDSYLLKYINSDNPNLNKLSQILDIQFSPLLPADLKYYANKKIKELQNKYFSYKNCIQTTYEVKFVPNLGKEKEIIIDGTKKISISYDLDWINNNLDYPTLFNNFIYLFEFIDSLGRLTNQFNVRESGIFEIIDFNKNTKVYNTNYFFEHKNNLSLISLNLYLSILHKHNIDILNMIEWFFDIYLSENFGISGFIFIKPTSLQSYSEKCQLLTSSFDSILKQLNFYINNGEINQEIISMDTRPIEIQCIPSLLKQKYFYGDGNKYHNIVHLLFSDQSPIIYTKIKHTSFAELLSKANIKKSEFNNYCASAIDFLITENILIEDGNGYLRIKNKLFTSILYELYRNQFLEYWNLSAHERTEVDKMLNLGYIRFSSNFLAEPEADYFNYFLNKHFSNGLEIRDKYAHGQAQLNKDENYHFKNYLILLKLLIMLILKMNDELCCYDIISKKETKS